jgi:hypothetical protein
LQIYQKMSSNATTYVRLSMQMDMCNAVWRKECTGYRRLE